MQRVCRARVDVPENEHENLPIENVPTPRQIDHLVLHALAWKVVVDASAQTMHVAGRLMVSRA